MTASRAAAVVFVLAAAWEGSAFAQPGAATTAPLNVAMPAKASTSFVSGHETLGAVNDGFEPRRSNDHRNGAYGNWPQRGTQWVQYDWPVAVSTGRIEVFWFDDRQGVHVPRACRLLSWDGEEFAPVPGAEGLGLAADQWNITTFPEIATERLRLEFDGEEGFSTGILEWKVVDSGKSPNFPPAAVAGPDRIVIAGSRTWLNGASKDDGKGKGTPTALWSKVSGPGEVAFEPADALASVARIGAPGEYELRLTTSDGELNAEDTLKVSVREAPVLAPLEPVAPTAYTLDSKLWNPRIKSLIVNWIPWCIAQCSDLNLREGGIANFKQAAEKLAGKEGARHVGYPFSNAWVLNTFEAMCLAQMTDARGDAEILAAQKAMRGKIEEWIPAFLAAQEPDGYFQTATTLGGRPRWARAGDGQHEGYVAGYFIEAGIAHFLMSGKQDRRLFNAAKKLADCWEANLGPAPKKAWHDGHQGMEMALLRLARTVDEDEGNGKGEKYVKLAKFLLDSRGGGQEYDQSHLPAVQQYEAVGHAVRAVYSYAGMAEAARRTGDHEYLGAVLSLWDNIVNRKYYVTGGVGSGETSEGFGPDFSLRNNAYCESCSGCGELFFQHSLNLIFRDAKYADLYEETLYNAVLGDIDFAGKNFGYTNPLAGGSTRRPWHACPCCVGNIARVLLELPAWTYAKSADAVFVNLYIGGTTMLRGAGGGDVEIVQATDYPWSGRIALTVNPDKARTFAVALRIPRRDASALYTASPKAGGLIKLAVNGAGAEPAMESGYAVIRREWKPGDKIELELPLEVQRIAADERIEADRGRTALRYGPLIYNFESVDQDLDAAILPESAPLTARWAPELLEGIVAIDASLPGGDKLLAIPNYARHNRGGRSMVWIRNQ